MLYRLRQHAEELEDAFAADFHLNDNVGNHNAGKHGDNCCRKAQRYAVKDSVLGNFVFKQDVFVVVKRQVFPCQRQSVGAYAAN